MYTLEDAESNIKRTRELGSCSIVTLNMCKDLTLLTKETFVLDESRRYIYQGRSNDEIILARPLEFENMSEEFVLLVDSDFTYECGRYSLQEQPFSGTAGEKFELQVSQTSEPMIVVTRFASICVAWIDTPEELLTAVTKILEN